MLVNPEDIETGRRKQDGGLIPKFAAIHGGDPDLLGIPPVQANHARRPVGQNKMTKSRVSANIAETDMDKKKLPNRNGIGNSRAKRRMEEMDVDSDFSIKKRATKTRKRAKAIKKLPSDSEDETDNFYDKFPMCSNGSSSPDHRKRRKRDGRLKVF